MAMNKYGAAESNLTIFGIPIEEFGDTDPAVTISDVENRSNLKRGLGGGSLRLDNVTRPKRLTVNLMPGSDEVRQIIAAEKTGADATSTFVQSGTGEKVVMFEGILETRGDMGRVGKSSVSDEQFVFLFNDSEES